MSNIKSKDYVEDLLKELLKGNGNKKQIKLKGAATDWWIGEHCINADNGKTYFTYMTLRGEIKITEIDTKNSNALSKTRTVCRMNQTYSDEHNAPGMIITPTGRIIVAYAGHNYSKNVYYRVTKNPYDLDSFGEEVKLVCSADQKNYLRTIWYN